MVASFVQSIGPSSTPQHHGSGHDCTKQAKREMNALSLLVFPLPSKHADQTSFVLQSLAAPDAAHEEVIYQNGHPALLNAIKSFHPLNYECDRGDNNTSANSTSSIPSMLSVDACRIFHGRGGLFPGADHLTLDYYPPVFLLTSFKEIPEDEIQIYEKALQKWWEKNATDGTCGEEEPLPFTLVYQCRAERGNSTTNLMAGVIPDPHIVTESSGQNKYLVHLLKGQNHGLFLDMSAGRKWLQNKCAVGEVSSVLNLFSYTCAFSVAALNGGADTVVNVDMSRGALKIGQRNHELNGLAAAGGAKFLSHDIWKTWGKMKKMGPYDAVVVDPPSYQKGSFVAANDYSKVIRRLPSLLSPNGWALLCLNAPELTTDFLLGKVQEEATDLYFVERLNNPPTFESAFSERALKVIVFQYRPSYENNE